jgi:nicotinate-nucleotide adenylyltransferase
MLRLAVEHETGFMEDPREQQRRGPSYMVWTLRSLRAELPQQPLALLLGADAFLALDTWFCWQQILALTHVIVLPRLGSPVSELTETWYRDAISTRISELERASVGRVYICDTPLIDVSASAIREKIGADEDVSVDVPDAVWTYIQQHGLYGCPAHPKHKHAV